MSWKKNSKIDSGSYVGLAGAFFFGNENEKIITAMLKGKNYKENATEFLNKL